MWTRNIILRIYRCHRNMCTIFYHKYLDLKKFIVAGRCWSIINNRKLWRLEIFKKKEFFFNIVNYFLDLYLWKYILILLVVSIAFLVKQCSFTYKITIILDTVRTRCLKYFLWRRLNALLIFSNLVGINVINHAALIVLWYRYQSFWRSSVLRFWCIC